MADRLPSGRFCVFILSHGRPDRVVTLDTLRRGNYTGAWYVIVDNEDATAHEYIRRYGQDRVIVFDKQAIAATFDTADLSDDRRTVVYARNACFDIARSLGVTHFLELDDDYLSFEHRYQETDRLMVAEARNLDRLFRAMVEYLDDSGAASVAFGQGGDLLGGIRGYFGRGRGERIRRKAMNTFFCRAADEWRFLGRINEDVNAYTTLSHRGLLFFTTLYATVQQQETQANPRGMTDVYRDGGTYAKSFYPTMMCPSAVRVSIIEADHPRIHHRINWNACAPKILSASCRFRATAPAEAAD